MQRLWGMAGEEMRTFDDTRGDLPKVLGYSRHDTLYETDKGKTESTQEVDSSVPLDIKHRNPCHKTSITDFWLDNQARPTVDDGRGTKTPLPHIVDLSEDSPPKDVEVSYEPDASSSFGFIQDPIKLLIHGTINEPIQEFFHLYTNDPIDNFIEEPVQEESIQKPINDPKEHIHESIDIEAYVEDHFDYDKEVIRVPIDDLIENIIADPDDVAIDDYINDPIEDQPVPIQKLIDDNNGKPIYKPIDDYTREVINNAIEEPIEDPGSPECASWDEQKYDDNNLCRLQCDETSEPGTVDSNDKKSNKFYEETAYKLPQRDLYDIEGPDGHGGGDEDSQNGEFKHRKLNTFRKS